jgi:hypothetical protein
MNFTGQEDQFITFEKGGEMTQRYRDQITPGDILGGYIGRDAMIALLHQEGCVGFRYYYALNDTNTKALVFVGVDSEGNDIIGNDKLCLDNAALCPPRCSTSNILNS